jgi:YYY domain-containing protein
MTIQINPQQNAPSPGSWLTRHRVAVGLFVLLSLALALRIYGINWDQGGLFHPDERAFLGQVERIEFPESEELDTLLTKESPLHPGSFNWGSLPHYMLKAVQYGGQLFLKDDLNVFDLRFPGRVLSALADTVTVALVFFLGSRWFSGRTGFLAAGMISLAVINIQLSHFFTVDALMTTFIVATVFFAIRYAYHGRTSDAALVGIMAGLGIATKFSVAPLGITVLTGFLIYAFSNPGETLDTRGWRSSASAIRQRQAFKGLLLASAVTLLTVLITQPYMFLDFSTFIGNIGDQSEMVRGINDWPFTRQYANTPRYWYQIFQLGFWGLGPAMGVVVWTGLAAGIAFAWFGRRKVDLVVLAWVIPYLLITGWLDVKFMRYMLPLVPFLVLYGARTLLWAGDMLTAVWPQRRYLVAAPAVVMLIFTGHYALSFTSIYSGPHPAQAASTWLEENATPGSRVVQEHWEEGTPRVRGLTYVHEQLELYNPDSLDKFTRITNLLVTSDYMVLFSNRLYGTIPRLPKRYPLSTDYYERLFDGSLGYELVFADTRAVQSVGITYREDPFARVSFNLPTNFDQPDGGLLTVSPGWADESFSVYDHPQVLIFENTGRLDATAMLREIDLSPVNQIRRKVGLLLDEDDLERQQSGGTWTDLAFLRSLPEGASWLVWLIAVEIFALLALPLSFVLFRPFPDRGYLLAKPLGLLIAATITWLMASAGVLEFGFGGALVGLLALGAISAFALWRRGSEMVEFLRAQKRLIITSEVLFLLAFMSFLAIRFANPDLWHPFRGGEKPMDFAYLNAVARSSVMPPFDPWFAGGFLNYYYFGQFLVADMIRITGIVPSIAYNLAVPLLFAFTFGAAFSVVYNLTSLTLVSRSGAAVAAKARSPMIAGIAGGVLVAVAGNIDGLVQLGEGARRAFADQVPAGAFDFWRSSRMFERNSPGNEITEFPFFSFLFADLHAHMIAIPFAILALALTIAVFVRVTENEAFWQRWGRLAVLGVAVGALRIINAWDFPTQLLLAGGAIMGSELFLRHKPLSARLAGCILKWLFVAAVGYIVFLPFHLNFDLFNNGVLKSEFQTPLWRYFAIHSVFLLVIISWIFFEIRDRGPAIRTWLKQYSAENSVPVWIAPFVLVAVSAAVLTFAFSQWGTIAFTVLLAIAVMVTAYSVYRSGQPGGRYVLAVSGFVVMAMALSGGVDIFTVKDDIGRMNTVFKFYLQAWWLLALATGYFLWLMWSAGHFSLHGLGYIRGAWMTGFAVLAVGVMVYPVLGTNVRIRDRFDTNNSGLDGAAFMETVTHVESGPDGVAKPINLADDLAAIEWLQRNAEGSPVIVEGLTDEYRWGGRVSIYTGLPAVIGWDWHQRQQRVNYDWAVTDRRQQVDSFFRTGSLTQAVELLDRYDVRYVYVGELERIRYPANGLEKFDRMAELGLTPVYSAGPVTIYKYKALETVSR